MVIFVARPSSDRYLKSRSSDDSLCPSENDCLDFVA